MPAPGGAPAWPQLGLTEEVRHAFRGGASIAALARDHHASRAAVRTALADLLPNQAHRPATSNAPEPQPVHVEIPGKIARRLDEHTGLGQAERQALRRGRTVRRGQGYSLHVTAPPDVHQALHAAAATLGGHGASAANRKAYRIYTDRLNNTGIATDPTS